MTTLNLDRPGERFDRPIFIISTPRSGSTLLFETLEQAPGLFTTGNESHGLIERIPGLSPADHGWKSNALGAADATPETAEQLSRAFIDSLRDRDDNRPVGRFRMLEKTPKNALRVPFFDAAFPDSLFVFLYRDARQTISSMIEAWASGRFRTYPRLAGWNGLAWSLLLVPGWPSLDGRPLPEIAASQWAITMNRLLDDLERLPDARIRVIEHDALLAAPQLMTKRLAASLDLGWDQMLGAQLPLSKTTVSLPSSDKWRQQAEVIEAVWPIAEQADARARAFVERINRPA